MPVATRRSGRRRRDCYFRPLCVIRYFGAVHAATETTIVTWSSAGQAARIVFGRRNLVRTIGVALVVGSILFAINQLDVVMAGDATTGTWIKSVSTFLVPFVVANYGVLTATRQRHNVGRSKPGSAEVESKR